MVGSEETKPGYVQSWSRLLDINELEELRNDAYFNSKIAKDKLKKWHGQLIARKNFKKGD